MNISEKLALCAEMNPEKVITTFNNRDTTYAEFYKQAKNLAGYFQAKGYQKEDIIAVYLPNSDYFLVCYYACQIGGFTILPVNTKLTAAEIDYIFTHSEAKALIYDERYQSVVDELKETTSKMNDLIIVGKDDHSLADILRGPELPVQKNDNQGEETAVVFYTSGTTGKPKGVMLSADNIKASTNIWMEAMDITSEDRMHIVAPLFHCAASNVFSLPVIYAGGTIIIEEGFSPDQALQTMEKEKVTIFFGVPAMYSILLNTPKMSTLDLSHLRLFTYGAAPMPYELVRKVKALFPAIKVQNLYGQTENSPAASTLKDHYALDKVGSVGEALPQTEIRVVDEMGEPVHVGEVGEIIVKGPQVMKGYLKNEEATNATIKDGWLYSGDLGRLDKDGLLYIVDRKKDMIIRGGENVYPVEVEEVLYEIPELLEAAVVGVPDEVLGEVPKAFVVLKEGVDLEEEEILHFCKKRLAPYKLPKEIERIESLPRNASGKVLKTNLRAH